MSAKNCLDGQSNSQSSLEAENRAIESALRRRNAPQHIFSTYGLGKRPPGIGSAVAWYDMATDRSSIKPIANLTPMQAAYEAVLDALRCAREGTRVIVYCSCKLLWWQWHQWREADNASNWLYRLHTVIEDRRLTVRVFYISQRQNAAVRLIERWIANNADGAKPR